MTESILIQISKTELQKLIEASVSRSLPKFMPIRIVENTDDPLINIEDGCIILQVSKVIVH